MPLREKFLSYHKVLLEESMSEYLLHGEAGAELVATLGKAVAQEMELFLDLSKEVKVMKLLSLALDVVRAILSLSNLTLIEANRMGPEVEALKEASEKSCSNSRCLMANSVMGCQYWSSKVEKMLNVGTYEDFNSGVLAKVKLV